MMQDARPFAKQIGRTIVKTGFKPDGTVVGQGGYPKLSDLCNFLEVPHVAKHSALDDVLSTHRCFRRMVELGYQPDFRVHESKNLEAIRNAS
jgi:DNA polymerase III epsilon subunit-like protein